MDLAAIVRRRLGNPVGGDGSIYFTVPGIDIRIRISAADEAFSGEVVRN